MKVKKNIFLKKYALSVNDLFYGEKSGRKIGFKLNTVAKGVE